MSDVAERTIVNEYDDGSISVAVDGFVQYAGGRDEARLLANAILQEVGDE